ncbi:nucleotide sugar dehydrogenase [Anaerococcus sp. WCA-380-WT-2B]|uniref:UDP-glucose 6-dehydrogenase n=1 Tax=Anaerococcus porci TaxID=2652269 RepID=A0A6N7VUG1_9FIRM|nr:nucleotide sugar dehydrogenase [Anaerococcus porci]MSS77674.1 nucleotide sugar dehydrogenase [Anaerococcus porci]
MKITVLGMGYVGLSNAILLSQSNEVIGIDVVSEKVNLINNKKSPLKDDYIINYLKNKNLNFVAKTSGKDDYADSDLVILALPTNYDEKEEFFDTHFLDDAIKEIKEIRNNLPILIKSTIPIGYTREKNEEYKSNNIYFSPEFLREGKALYDSLHPSRIIVSENGGFEKEIARLYKSEALNNPKVLLMKSDEAESVKLFANTYLAMRVSFFNELDTFAIAKGLDSKNIIEGISEDPRIGNYYNNPSFGYGGYCLPKDTRQLYANYKEIPNALFKPIIESNEVRKEFIAKDIMTYKPKQIGIYRLVMKKGSDNFRKSAIFDIIEILKKENVDLIIYEPTVDSDEFEGLKVINNLEEFKEADIIIANRISDDLKDIEEKVYSRDIFTRD